MENLTTIAVQKDTQRKLSNLKVIKKPGKLENYDDVIRRGMGFDEQKQDKPAESSP